MRNYKFPAITVLLVLLFFSNCKKETPGVPYVYVNIQIYVNDPQFVNLNAVGGWVYVTGGYRGLLIYRKSTTEFMAYDRSCTHDPGNADEYVKMDANNIEAVDSNCGSRFVITDGSVTKGPAGIPLKAYQTSFDGSVLRVFN